MGVNDWTALAGFGGLVLIQSLAAFGYIEARLRQVAEKAETKIAGEGARIEKLVDTERTQRQQDVDRITRALEAFGKAGVEMGRVALSVEHLAKGLEAHAALTDRNIGELKASIRDVDQKISAMTAPAPRLRRVPG